MRGVRLPMTVVLLVIVAFPVRNCIADNQYQKINQGDWAVALVRGLKLDRERQPNKLDDFTTLLAGVSIEPKEGWQVDYQLSFEDCAGTISQSLQYLNSSKSDEIYSAYGDFLGFLEYNVGVRMTALMDGLKNNREQDLRTHIGDYLKSEVAEEESSIGVESDRLFSRNDKQAQMSALFIRGTIMPDNYWKIFNRPSSPILPGKFN